MRQPFVLSLAFSFLSAAQGKLTIASKNANTIGGPNDLPKTSHSKADTDVSITTSKDISKSHYYPYLASLQLYEDNIYKHLCCAIIIHEEIVLTTAHCLNSPTRPFVDQLSITAGSNELFNEKTMQRFSVIYMLDHHKYKPLYGYDIALLRVKPKFPIDNKNYGIIDVFNTARLGEDVTGRLLGWGKAPNKSHGKKKLEKMTYVTLADDTCLKKHRFKYLTSSEICGMHTAGAHGACDGESGCPLVQANDSTKLMGLLSYGRKTCQTKQPYAFTRISSFTQWIRNEMGKMLKN